MAQLLLSCKGKPPDSYFIFIMAVSTRTGKSPDYIESMASNYDNAE